VAGGGSEHRMSSAAAEPDTEAKHEQVFSRDAAPACEATTHRTSDRTRQPRQLDGEPAACDDVRLVLDGWVLDEVTLVNSALWSYLAMVATVLEGRSISTTQLLQVLRRSMRQRSFDRLPRREYVLRVLNQHPPWRSEP